MTAISRVTGDKGLQKRYFPDARIRRMQVAVHMHASTIVCSCSERRDWLCWRKGANCDARNVRFPRSPNFAKG